MNINHEAAKLLRDAIALIEDPEHWTVACDAKTEEGRRCAPTNEAATKWCMVGALQKVSSDDHTIHVAYHALRDHTSEYVSQFNDTHTHDEVLSAMREAAESLEKE